MRPRAVNFHDKQDEQPHAQPASSISSSRVRGQDAIVQRLETLLTSAPYQVKVRLSTIDSLHHRKQIWKLSQLLTIASTKFLFSSFPNSFAAIQDLLMQLNGGRIATRRAWKITALDVLIVIIFCLALTLFEFFFFPKHVVDPYRAASTAHASVYDLEELMTPKLIRKIERQKNNCLSPPHVHLIWIGDINKAPIERIEYIEKGYTLTVHTDPEEILDGFHPYVLKAYYQAVPKVVGYDFLKFALLYKYGGFAVDADTTPAVPASEIKWPSDCELIFGKEANAKTWEKPVFRLHGGADYGLVRPFQILNWAMAVTQPRNPHIKYMLKSAIMHFLGLRDMEDTLVQDISGSGLMTDYVAWLHERRGQDYRKMFMDRSKHYPVEGLCLTDGHMHGKWIKHAFLGSWKQAETG